MTSPNPKLCTWNRNVSDPGKRRQMVAHPARLSEHVDDVKGEQQVLAQLFHRVVGIDFPD